MAAPLNHTMLAITLGRHINGQRYDKVPDHVTVLPWVELGENRGRFMRAAREVCSLTSPISLDVEGLVTVGAEGYERPGFEVAGDQLYKLHKALFAEAVQLGVSFSDPQWLDVNYFPHTTAAAPPRSITVNRLTVIDNFRAEGQERGVKTITQQFAFGSI